jgi:uncharacterized protein with von Willebrand factor type A (vWA) domain
MDNFTPKLMYISKVLKSVDRLEHFEIVENWANNVFEKHKFENKEEKHNAMFKLHRLTHNTSKSLENRWMQTQASVGIEGI